jgi:hypothetical protein
MNNTIIALVVFVAIIVIVVLIVFRSCTQPKDLVIDTVGEYVRRVYPLLPAGETVNIKDFDYFYYNAVTKDLMKKWWPNVGNCTGVDFATYNNTQSILQGNTSKNGDIFGSVCKNTCTGCSKLIPAWVSPKNTFWVSPYDEKVLGQNVKPFQSNSLIEISHTCCNYPYGVWVNSVKGSGIFYDLGKTLSARNKIALLLALGHTAEQLADSSPDFSWNGWSESPTDVKTRTYNSEQELLSEQFGITSLAQLFGCVADPRKVPYGNTSAIYFISDTVYYDKLLWKSGIAKGYDTMQMYASGYGGGFWMFEIIDCRQKTIHELRTDKIIVLADPNNLDRRENCTTEYLDAGDGGYNAQGLWCSENISDVLKL